MKIDRLIAILLYLLSRDKVTARELSAYFGTSLRTIYRDMETLSLAGVPIASFQGTEGGYGLVESFKLDRTFFKENELLALFSALKGINAAIGDKTIESVLLKLKVLAAKSRGAEKKEDLPPVIYLPLPWGGAPAAAENVERLRKAVERRRVASFNYTKTDGSKTRRRVEPLSLVLLADIWYLYAWDLRKKDYRFFRLSRVSALEVDEKAVFVRRPGKKPYPWESNWDSGTLVDIVLLVDPASVQKVRDSLPWAEEEAQEDGSRFFRYRSPWNEWAESQILAMGAGAEVLEPPSARERIRAVAALIAERNGKDRLNPSRPPGSP